MPKISRSTNSSPISEQESIANTDDLRQKVEEEYWKRESDRIDEIYKSRSISEEEAQRRVEEQRQREERRQLKRENIVLFMQTKKTTDDVVAENNDNLTDTI